MVTPTSLCKTQLTQSTTGGGHAPRAKHERSLSGSTDHVMSLVVRELPPVCDASIQTGSVSPELPTSPLATPPKRLTSVTSQTGQESTALPTAPHNTPPARPIILPPHVMLPPHVVKMDAFDDRPILPSNTKLPPQDVNMKVYATPTHEPFSSRIVIE